jgi:hypothetical protein
MQVVLIRYCRALPTASTSTNRTSVRIFKCCDTVDCANPTAVTISPTLNGFPCRTRYSTIWTRDGSARAHLHQPARPRPGRVPPHHGDDRECSWHSKGSRVSHTHTRLAHVCNVWGFIKFPQSLDFTAATAPNYPLWTRG